MEEKNYEIGKPNYWFLVFSFGYYFYKGMWKKGLVIFLFMILSSLFPFYFFDLPIILEAVKNGATYYELSYFRFSNIFTLTVTIALQIYVSYKTNYDLYLYKEKNISKWW